VLACTLASLQTCSSLDPALFQVVATALPDLASVPDAQGATCFHLALELALELAKGDDKAPMAVFYTLVDAAGVKAAQPCLAELAR